MSLIVNSTNDEAILWDIMTNLAVAVAAVSKEIQPPGKCTKQNAPTAEKTAKYHSNPLKVNRYYAATATEKRKVPDNNIRRNHSRIIDVQFLKLHALQFRLATSANS
jgi:hypothetical protein